jgi:hypothetical protein
MNKHLIILQKSKLFFKYEQFLNLNKFKISTIQNLLNLKKNV